MTLKSGVRALAAGLALACASSVAIAADAGKPGDTPTVERGASQEVLSNDTQTTIANNYATENSGPMGLERVPPPLAYAPKTRKVAIERPAAPRHLVILGIAY